MSWDLDIIKKLTAWGILCVALPYHSTMISIEPKFTPERCSVLEIFNKTHPGQVMRDHNRRW